MLQKKKLWLHVETICFSEYRSLGSSVFEAKKAMGKWKMKSCGFASLLLLLLHASPLALDKTEYEKQRQRKQKKCKVRLYNCTNEYIQRQCFRISGAVMHHTFHMNICLTFTEVYSAG